MADIYVWSGATGLNNGTSFTDAYTAFASAATAATNADRIFVAHDHSESLGASTTYTFPTSPGLQVLCINRSTSLLATTGAITTNGNFSLTFDGHAYVYGLVLTAGNAGAGTTKFLRFASASTAHRFVLESCTFVSAGSSTLSVLRLGGSNSNTAKVTAINCSLKFGAAGQTLNFGADATVRGMTIDATGSTPTTLIDGTANIDSNSVLVEASDLSGVAFTNLVDVSTSTTGTQWTFRNCKLPAGVAITTGSFAGPSNGWVRLHNCDSGDTNYRFAEHRYEGTVVHETTIVRTSGASDGTTPLSWKMVSNANPKFFDPLVSPEIARWNETTGSSLTATVEIVTDNVTLTDAEAWLEIQYLGTSGVPLGSLATDRAADILATAANQATSTVGWTTTGLGTPVKQKLEVTFTPQEKGVILAKVHLAKASTTVYVDPLLTVA